MSAAQGRTLNSVSGGSISTEVINNHEKFGCLLTRTNIITRILRCLLRHPLARVHKNCVCAKNACAQKLRVRKKCVCAKIACAQKLRAVVIV
jgi:hypothetical protein